MSFQPSSTQMKDPSSNPSYQRKSDNFMHHQEILRNDKFLKSGTEWERNALMWENYPSLSSYQGEGAVNV